MSFPKLRIRFTLCRVTRNELLQKIRACREDKYNSMYVQAQPSFIVHCLKYHHPPPSRWKHGRQISSEGQRTVGRLAHETARRAAWPDQPSLRCRKGKHIHIRPWCCLSLGDCVTLIVDVQSYNSAVTAASIWCVFMQAACKTC